MCNISSITESSQSWQQHKYKFVVEEGVGSLAPVGVAQAVVAVAVVGEVSLGGGVQTLGDRVQAAAGAEGHVAVSVGVAQARVVRVGISLGRGEGSNTSLAGSGLV